MLLELIQHATTPSLEYARKMGYLKEAVATHARYRRQKASWAPHLEKSMRFIANAAKDLPKRRKALILGAGNCYDVPIEVLSKVFDEVICVDVVISKYAGRLARKYDLNYVQADVTCVAQRIFENPEYLAPYEPNMWTADKEIDFVVSANILSQLPLIPKAWLQKHSGHTQAQIERFCRDIVQNHINYLENFTAKACLITDFEFKICDKGGAIFASEDALFGVGLPKAEAVWDWNIAPVGEYNKNYALKHKVKALCL